MKTPKLLLFFKKRLGEIDDELGRLQDTVEDDEKKAWNPKYNEGLKNKISFLKITQALNQRLYDKISQSHFKYAGLCAY